MDLKKYNLGYSLKNIPLPNNNAYLKQLIFQTEKFLKRVRWRVYHFERNQDHGEEEEASETYGFKTLTTPPQHQDLLQFEDDMYRLIANIKFVETKDKFQSRLKQDIKKLKSGNKVMVSADKTTNLYQVSDSDYRKLVSDNITKDYKKSEAFAKRTVDRKSKQLINNIDQNLSKRMEAHSQSPCFITLKDHKDGFASNPKCRLINPAKTDLGKVSKQILVNINNKIRASTGLKQWRCTAEVISWFSDLCSKNRKCKFLQFDIVEFYPSISPQLLDRSLEYAKTLVNVSTSDIDIIKHSKMSLLFDTNGECWTKKNGFGNFDVTMGSFDGAEVSELVGLYLLSKITTILPTQCVGLYRDDGLAIIEHANGPMLDRIRKKLHSCFKKEGLGIEVETGMHQANFLDVTLNLLDGSYKPFRKPNDTALYIHKSSNHPHNIIKNLPKMIEKRLSSISSSKGVFDEAKTEYEVALKASGFEVDLKYNPNSAAAPKTGKKRRRGRNITWFNPPFSKNVSTDLGRKFFALIDHHFPRHHKLHKIINRNTVKLSYSCMPNIGRIIKASNRKVLEHSENNGCNAAPKTCNCRVSTSCPLGGNCLTTSVVYEATLVTENSTSHKYIGLTEGPFKTRFNGHNQTFRHEKHRNSSEISKKVWELKDAGTKFEITWKILQQAQPYKGGSANARCDLCISEKLHILNNPGALNKRTEIVSKCRHARKYLLQGVT